MRVTLATVMSVDGRITQGETVKTSFWRSVEDGKVLKKLIAHHQVLVMGRNTYDVVHPGPKEHHLQVVLTSQPDMYADDSVPGSMEFVSVAPTQLVSQLQARGYTSILLLGGSSNVAFLRAGLVDDLYLTIEPAIFGEGLPLAEGLPAAISLKLVEMEQLNRQGTSLLHYEVIKRPAATPAGQ
jgi:dihydrofolate reductase